MMRARGRMSFQDAPLETEWKAGEPAEEPEEAQSMGDLVPRAQRYGVVRHLTSPRLPSGALSPSRTSRLLLRNSSTRWTRSTRRASRVDRAREVTTGGNDTEANEKEGATVLNPTKPKKGKGRTETKRKRGATGK